MATVILPLGYPEQSGTFVTIVYQGTVARQYTIPTDPRTESQTFHRKRFADVKRMLSTLGKWSRSAVHAAFGEHYHAVLYQYCKGDVDSHFSTAWDAFENFTDGQQEDWRSFSPYQATYNDPGQVFYAVATCTYYALAGLGGHAWQAYAWTASDVEECEDWWTKDITGAFLKGTYNDDDARFIFGGNWINVPEGPCYGGQWRYGPNGTPSWVGFYWVGTYLVYGYFENTGQGTVEVFIDGVSRGTFSQNAAEKKYKVYWVSDLYDKRLHYAEFRRVSGYPTIDWITIYDVKADHIPYLVTGDGFVMVTGNGCPIVITEP